MMCFIVLYYISSFLSIVFQCSPIPKVWAPELQGTCIQVQLKNLVTGVVNLVTDLLILGFSLACAWNLKLTLKQKVGIIGVFLIGGL